jgi:hypothetical protein
MRQMIAGLQASLGLSLSEVEQLTLHNPRRVLAEEPPTRERVPRRG